MRKWFDEFKRPKKLISDNGRQFISNKFKNFLKSEGVKHVLIPEYSPFSNGISERINRTLNEIFRIYSGKKLTSLIKIAKRRLNMIFNSGVEEIPFEIVMRNKKPVLDRIYNENKSSSININDLLFVKRFGFYKKSDYLYEGSVRIVAIGDKRKWVKVEGLKNWQHIKNIKIYKGDRL